MSRLSLVLLLAIASALNVALLLVAVRYYNTVHVLTVDPIGVAPGTTQYRPLHYAEVLVTLSEATLIVAGIYLWRRMSATGRRQ